MSLISQKKYFELKSDEDTNNDFCFLIKKTRVVIGSTESCDIIIPFPEVSPIHSIIEIKDGKFKVFDMNSEGGTFLNGVKILSEEFKLGDKFSFSSFDFIFKKYEKIDLPPILDMVDPVKDFLEDPPEFELKDDKIEEDVKEKKSPKPLSLKKRFIKKEIKKVKFPLDKDSKASYSEYIFEDADNLLPIFKYKKNKMAIEVSVLHRNEILSITYFDSSIRKQFLIGKSGNKKNEIEFPVLNKNDKHCLVQKKRGKTYINRIPGFDFFHLSDEKTGKVPNESVHLESSDIVRLYKGEIQVFLRFSDSPPKVDPAPFFSKDNELKKFSFLVFFLLFIFFIGIGNVEFNREIKEEKLPKLVATILYRPKPKPVEKKVIHKVGSKEIKKTEKSPIVKKDKKLKSEVKKVELKKESNNQVTKKKVKKVISAKPLKIKKGKASKKNKVIKKVKIVAPSPQKKKIVKFKKSSSKSRKTRKSPGRIKVYDATKFNFDSTVSKMLAKGGSTRVAKVKKNKLSGIGFSGIKSGGQGEKVKGVHLSDDVGDLEGSNDGALDTGKGLEGLSNKKGISLSSFPSKTVILGNYDPSLIRKILVDNMPQFKHCYQRILDSKSRLFNGIIWFRFKIGASGRVLNAGISKQESKVPSQVKKCVLNVLRGIQFPPPKGGGIVEVNQPLNFQGKNLTR
ncbi:AgmX/PglI C-terminal domain-containing protein [Bacteriovoracales bacterium]|nr:AgmX/PglI C-terminal domain-containing protein [Bacteriovoracales bacterium]